MTHSAGMRSLAVKLPKTVRTNDYWRERYPEMVATAEQQTLSKIWSGKEKPRANSAAWDIEMQPYLSDPFRGALKRHVLLPGETTCSLQVAAASDALIAAKMEPRDVEMALVATFYPEHPEHVDTGNAAFVARDLGLGGTVLNIDSACSSSVQGFQMACALVNAGEYERVLVVVACRYSHVLEETDTMSWFLADGAGAFVVTRGPQGDGFLGAKSEHTAETCGVFFSETIFDPIVGAQVRMRSSDHAGRVLRDASTDHLPVLCRGAAEKAGVSFSDIKFFVFNTPTAWFAAFAARALGIDPERTISTYSEYGNIGPTLMPVNLYRAASTGRIKKGDLVLMYAIGSVSSAIAVVMRWGDVALGPSPI